MNQAGGDWCCWCCGVNGVTGDDTMEVRIVEFTYIVKKWEIEDAVVWGVSCTSREVV